MEITKVVGERFEDYIVDWDYETYLVIGGYGSGKSYETACKIILKCLSEKRKVLVLRNVFDTIYHSCYDLMSEILEDMNLLCTDRFDKRQAKTKVLKSKSPLGFSFPNGSKIIFKGLDDESKIKSINGISIVWVEEACA